MQFVEGTRLNGVSRICFGCEQLGGIDWGDVNVDELSDTVRLALQHGVNFFDTAAVYGLGLSESRLGAALGVLRAGVRIATKGGLTATKQAHTSRAKISRDASPEAITAGVEGSLQRLGIESIPLYYLHWPDQGTPIRDTMEVLTELKRDGKILLVGLSNFNYEQVSEARRYGDVDVVQVPFSLISRQTLPVIESCHRDSMAVCVYGVLEQGLLSGKYSSRQEFGANDRRHRLAQFAPGRLEDNLVIVDKLVELAANIDKTPAQIAIRYALQAPGVSSVVVGLKSRAQLEHSTDVFDWELTQEQLRYLDS